MQTKKLLILAIAAVAAIGLGIWVASERSASPENDAAALYPDLKKSLNDVTAIRIFNAGDKQSVEIARKDARWVITERYGFPADDAKVRKLLLNLANAKIQEEKTSKPESYPSLGVEDLSVAGASGVRIEVLGSTPAVNLIVGKQGPGMESQYVRRAGESASWLIDSDLDTTALPQDWLQKTVLEISADRIQSARIETSGSKPYTAAKTSKTDADFAVEGLPKGKKLSAPGAANTLATALAGLPLSDVQPADSIKETPRDKAVYQTFDGLVVELSGWSREDKRYVAVQSRFDEALANRFKAPAQPAAAESAPAEKTDQSKDASTKMAASAIDAAQQSKALSEKSSGWAFEIPEYKYNAIFKPVADLLAE